MKALTAFILFLILPLGIILGFLAWLNYYLLSNSWFGFTFIGVDVRVWFLGTISFMLYFIGLFELDDYLQFKEWRRKWK